MEQEEVKDISELLSPSLGEEGHIWRDKNKGEFIFLGSMLKLLGEKV